jgi:hypothetical protein
LIAPSRIQPTLLQRFGIVAICVPNFRILG